MQETSINQSLLIVIRPRVPMFGCIICVLDCVIKQANQVHLTPHIEVLQNTQSILLTSQTMQRLSHASRSDTISINWFSFASTVNTMSSRFNYWTIWDLRTVSGRRTQCSASLDVATQSRGRVNTLLLTRADVWLNIRWTSRSSQ